ncbi:MAG: signal recognition particle-docking protein FtsY [Methylococcales bacterium]
MFKNITILSVFLALVAGVLFYYLRINLLHPEVFCSNVTVCQFSLNTYYLGLPSLLVLSGLLLLVLSWSQKQNRLQAVGGSLIFVALLLSQIALFLKLGLSISTISFPKSVLLIDLGVWGDDVLINASLILSVAIAWLIFWMYLRIEPLITKFEAARGPSVIASISMVLLSIEIILGFWLVGHRPILECGGVLQCNGTWLPGFDFRSLLNVLSQSADTALNSTASISLYWLHQVIAIIGLVLFGLLIIKGVSSSVPKAVKKATWWLLILLLVQLSLGIVLVHGSSSDWVAIAHELFATLLMLPLIGINIYSRYGYVESLAAPSQKAAVETSAVVVDFKSPETLFERLKTQLVKTRSGLSGVLAVFPLGQKGINEDLLEEIEASLLMADIGVDATAAIIARLSESIEQDQMNDSEALSAVLKQELLAMLRPSSLPLQIPKQDGPFVILVVGVNGAGKTTTIGKLAKRLQTQGHTVMLAAGDTFRAAAVEQLQTWGERNNIPVVAQHTGADSASVIYDALQSAQAKGIDVLIADTAGRLHTKSHLMDELKKVKRIMSKLDENAPHEVLLVLDAGTGQNALSQAKLFNETVELTGIALTKLDGTAKGGVIFALARQFGIPIRYIGIGEGIDDLQDFDADVFVNALFNNE